MLVSGGSCVVCMCVAVTHRWSHWFLYIVLGGLVIWAWMGLAGSESISAWALSSDAIGRCCAYFGWKLCCMCVCCWDSPLVAFGSVYCFGWARDLGLNGCWWMFWRDSPLFLFVLCIVLGGLRDLWETGAVSTLIRSRMTMGVCRT